MKMNRHDIENLIDHAKNTLINSVDEEGYPACRALLAVRKRIDLKIFYFSTNTSTNKVQHFKSNPKSSLYFFDSAQFVGCLLKGEMEVLNDSASRELVWRAGDQAYYPLGIEDPDMSVLKFTARAIRTYSQFNSMDLLP